MSSCLQSMNSEELRFSILVRLGRRLVPEYRFRWPNLDWVTDPTFTDYLKRFGEFEGLNADRPMGRLSTSTGGRSRVRRHDRVRCIQGFELVPDRIADLDARHGQAPPHLRLVRRSVRPVTRRRCSLDERGDLMATEDELRSNLADFSAINNVHPG